MSHSSAAPGSSPAPALSCRLRRVADGAGAVAIEAGQASPPRSRARLALRTALTLAVILIVLSTALLIHLSWSHTARQNVTDVAAQLNGQIVDSIRSELTGVLRNAQATEEAVRSIFAQEAIKPEDESKREFVFLALLQAQPALSWISFAWPSGDFFGAEKVDEDEIHMVEVRWNPLLHQAKRRVDRYLPEPGDLRFLERTIVPTGYTALDQNWYRKAVRSDRTVWTMTTEFPDRRQPGINISGKFILYDRFVGVINVTIELSRLSRFLSELHVSSSGTVAILDTAENVIASPEPAEREAERAGMMRSLASLDPRQSPLLAIARDAMSANRMRLSEHKSLTPLPLPPFRAANGGVYFVTFSPLDFRDWNVVTVIPEKDFLANIDRNTQRLLYGLAGFTLVMILAAILLADRILGRPLIRIAGQLRHIEGFRLDRIARIASPLRELDDLSAAMIQMAHGLTSFQKYLPTELVRTLVSQGIEAKPGGQQQTLTVLFSDLANFTSLSERLGADIVPILTDYLSRASRAIVAEGGTIDKFIGDAVMAFWGAPMPNERHAEAACRAALACRRALAEVTTTGADGRPAALHLRIGINTGPMLVGNIGSEERLNYTVIGDSVNLASRLEAVNKVYGTEIIIGEATRRSAGASILVRELDTVAVYGRMEGTAIFELLAMAEEGAAQCWAWVADYEAGLAAYRARRWQEAVACLERTIAKRPGGDAAAAILIERCRSFQLDPPGPDWVALTVMGSK
jgi:adenylate cyclase